MVKAVLFDLGGTLVKEGQAIAFPHVVNVLDELRSKFKLAIVCNTNTANLEDVKEILKQVGILHFFDAVIVSKDVGFSKPDERIFQIALERIGVHPSEAVMVGNRVSTDILGGNKTGLKTILIKHHGEPQEEMTCEMEKPSQTIYSLKELLHLEI